MTTNSFLYGFSAVGLQDFIFRTNALREIIGASELIKKIDGLGENLAGFLQENGVNLTKNPEVILSNAGNFRAIFDSEADLQNVIKYLPKLIAKNAYGLQIAQSLVKIQNNGYKSANSTLESRLKIARNKIAFPLDFSHCLLKHNPKTFMMKSRIF